MEDNKDSHSASYLAGIVVVADVAVEQTAGSIQMQNLQS